MARNMRERLDDEVLAASAARFGVTPDELHFVGGYRKIVYAFERDGQGLPAARWSGPAVPMARERLPE